MAMDRNSRTVAICLTVVASMTGLAYASVPFYRWFCQVTGFDGTTGVADAAPDASQISSRVIRVRFDSNVHPGLTWDFAPSERSALIHVGDVGLTHYTAHNWGKSPTRGHATYNVTPEKAGKYFVKVACFCFTDQPLSAGETREMPVNYFIDPAILNDPFADDITEITLSYTFFKQEGATAAADADASSAPN
jgi:cytochrome c oxidase assembly protein subunit 11